MIIAASLSGLTAFKLFPTHAERNDESAAQVADKAMVAAFWPDPFNHANTTQQEWETTIHTDWIEIQHTEYLFAQSMGQFYEKEAAFDSAKDEVAQKYVETGKARGNTVKLLKAPVNQAIYRLFDDPDQSPRHLAVLTDRDPALIEFSPEGRVVSALIRVAKAAPNLATIRRHYFSRIYMDPNHRWIENKLSNRLLEDNLISVQ